jgi:DNA replication and repair protein RecF
MAVGLTRLRLTDFRCYTSLDLRLDGASPVVLTGHNGAGKTNLLEAASYLAPGRGLRGARLGDVTRGNGDADRSWTVAATVIDSEGATSKIGTGLEPSKSGGGAVRRERRVVRVDGESIGGPAALSDRMRLSWITPQMDRLFTEAPSGRRRFMDRLAYGFDPNHARRVSAYERAQRERSKVLREYGAAADPAWLDALENTLAEQGVAIAAARLETIARLRGAIAAGVGPFPGAEIAMNGQVEGWLGHMAAVDAEDQLSASLKRARSDDATGSGAAVGPHKSDLAVRHRAKDVPAELCSTGEQKALLIAIILAEAGVHAGLGHGTPILLLDEVAAHLDQDRRHALFEELSALDAQVWLTGTDRELFRPLDGRAEFFTVDDGRVTAENGGV